MRKPRTHVTVLIAGVALLVSAASAGASPGQLALIQDDVARDVARTDPAPSIRHRVGGALELSLPSIPEGPA
jgi:hypothetical protein